ncbi:DoxX family protein [Aquimarina sp. 2201CG14-23]|uniref:DoxX family protein n=1 Tax=Aquimarina mycalae TaxID=3040073 RepID=UPI0024781B55|nr:hypothetical protein [Aquimarina sp. 2201CG14-23]MDH7447856.1 hypothetical protein [Aquimarina sp. 2201CG14-23]
MKRLVILLFTVLISISVNSQNVKEISRSWTSFAQSIEVSTDSVKKFKVVANVKLETSDKKAWAGVWARVDNKPEQGRGFFDNMRDRPIKSNTWNSYVVEGTIDSKSEKLVFGGISLMNGKFFYDKFEVYLEDDNGEYQPVNINNASFENRVTDNIIPGWNPGISKGEVYSVKEFTSSSSEDSVDGNYSVLVEGKGISENTGSSEATSAKMGGIIPIIYILILVFCFLTYVSSTEDEKWSRLTKIGFRFSFIYFFFIIFFQNNGAYPYFDYITEKPIELLQKIAIWFGEQVIGIPYKINTGPNGSGDTTYDYLVIFIGFIVALLVTLIWSVLDRNRPNYKKLYYWLTTALRYYVGLMLINYGLAKVIQLQFPAPSFYRLMEPYGESSPMGLAWTFLGFSEGYNMFMGIAEVLAGLLLFRRTLTFGAVITLMTAMNVMAVNYFFDVPVKILSTHLVLMTLFLLSRDIRKVMQFLVTNKPVENITLIKRPQFKKGVTIGLNVLKGLVLVYALGYGFYDALDSRKLYGTEVPKPPLYGVYEVTNYVINGDTITNYKSDKLWKNIRFEREGRVQIRKMDKKDLYYKVEVDSVTQKVKFSPSGNSADYFDFNYTRTDESLDFNYIYKNDTISGQTKRLDKDDFLLMNRGFHWISEYPYNR